MNVIEEVIYCVFVNLLVLLEVRVRGKRLGTAFAFIWSFASVKSLVSFQIGDLMEKSK